MGAIQSLALYSSLIWPIFFIVNSFSYRYMPTYSKQKDEADLGVTTDTDTDDPAGGKLKLLEGETTEL